MKIPFLEKLFCWEKLEYRSIDLYDSKILRDFGTFTVGTKFHRINIDLNYQIIRLFDEKNQLLGKFKINLEITELKSDRMK